VTGTVSDNIREIAKLFRYMLLTFVERMKDGTSNGGASVM
jgi:hypothetical protein